jgi:hypothetical protein|nr:MAG TPA: putative periplasmic lipoprotein [Caudoviricetes sp.]
MKATKIICFVCCLVAAILVSVAFGVISSSYISVLSGFVASAFLVVGKKAGDYFTPSSNGHLDWYDLLAGVIGALIGSQIGWFF